MNYYLSGTITSGMSNPAIKQVLGVAGNGLTSQSDYLGGVVGFVDEWVSGVNRFFQVPGGVFIGVLFILLIGSVLIHNSKSA